MTRLSRSRRGLLATVLASGLAAACDDAPPRDPPEAPPRTKPVTGAESASPATSTSAPASATATATAAAAAAAPGSLAGAWEGAYDAKKGTVGLPPKVKDKTWKNDDGKAFAGPGTVKLTVGPSGEVTGKAEGSLGASTLSGHAEGDTLRVSIFPADPTAPGAMTGVLIGMLKGDAIAAEIRVAGPDASTVRESAIELKRK